MSKLLKVWKKEIFMNKHKGLFSSASYSELNIRYGMIKQSFHIGSQLSTSCKVKHICSIIIRV